jgi:hypothetical protein
MDDMFRSSDISSASLYWCRISSTFCCKRPSIVFLILLPLPGRCVDCTLAVKAEISYFLYLACKGRDIRLSVFFLVPSLYFKEDTSIIIKASQGNILSYSRKVCVIIVRF